MSAQVTCRWLDGPFCSDQDWARLDNLLEKRGWSPLNRSMSRVYLAEQGDEIVGFSVLQMLPFAGPLHVKRELRGSGLADKLATDTVNYLVECEARGWFVVADSPHVPRLCERLGMHKVESPVYITLSVGVPTVSKKEVA
jgi:hypothetical protein